MKGYVANFGVQQSLVADSRGEEVCQSHHPTVHTTRDDLRGSSMAKCVCRPLEWALPMLCAEYLPEWPQYYLPSSQAMMSRAVRPSPEVEVLCDGGAGLFENVFTGQDMQQAAEKVQPYRGQAEWLVQADCSVSDVPEEDEPPRLRCPPQSLVAEC